MKQFLTRFLVAVALLLPVTMSAQTLTVCDGTAQEAHFPVYGLYMDASQTTQMLYVDSLLTSMRGQAVTSLTFYGTNSASWSSTVTVSMGVVPETSIGTSLLTATLTDVYVGQLSVNANNQLVLSLDGDYVYPSDGGNLLIQFSQTTGGNYENVSFYGVSAPGMGYHSYAYGSAQGFLPKLTFGYSTPSNCPRPSDIVVTGIQDMDATIGWTENGTATSWSLIVSDTLVDDLDNYTDIIATSMNPYTLTGLSYNTFYNVYVRAECGSESSYWRGPVSFRSACGIPTALPYSTGFESDNHGDVPACWTALASGMSSAGVFPSVYNYSSNTHSGQNYFEMESSNGETEVVALPTFSNDSPLQMSFYARDYSTYTIFEAGYIVDDTVFVTVDTIEVNQTGYGSEPHVVFYQNVPGSYITPAFRTSKNGSYTLFIDDLTVEEMASCVALQHLRVDSLQADTVFFSFADANAANSYYVVVSDTLVTDFDEWEAVEIYETNGMVDQLLSNHVYYLYAQANCGSEQSAWAGPVSFRTPCFDYTAVPYFNDLESEETYALPACWDKVSSTDYPYVYGYNTAVSGSNTLYFYNYAYGSNTTEQIVVLPEFEDLSVLRLSFYLRSNSDPTIQVGVWDSNAFHAVETLDYVADNNYHQVEAYFANYEGEGHRPAVRVNGGTFTVIMDDFMVDSASMCLPVNALVATNAQMNSIDLNWVPRGEETMWNIVYDTVPVTDFANAENTLSESTYPATVSGLAAGTTYYFYVQADCGGEGSEWAMCQGTTALCDGGCVVTINMEDSFGDGWNGGTIVVAQGGTTVAEVTLASGSTGVANVQVCPNDTITFSWNAGSYDSEVRFTVVNHLWETVYTCSEGADSLGAGFFQMVTDCMAATCDRPENLVVDSLNETTVNLSWNGGSASNWMVLYGTEPVTFGNANATVLTTNMPQIAVTGLNANTIYYFTVAADCGGDTSSTNSVSARTSCGNISTLPWTETFASTPAYDAPTCWETEGYSTGYNDYPYVDGYTSNLTPNALEFYLSSYYTGGLVNTAATPAIEGYNMSELQVEFYELVNSYNIPSLFEVGVQEDSAFVPVDTIYMAADGSFHYHVTYFTNYTGNGNRIGFRVSSNDYAYLYLDDITVSVAPDCYPVQNVVANSTGANSVQVSWTSLEGSSFNVIASDTVVTNFDAWVPTTTTTTDNATLNNLQNGSTYYFYVQTDCGTSTSTWVGPVQAFCGGYVMAANSTDTLYSCGLTVFDDGGFVGDYSNSQTTTLVVMPDTVLSAVAITGSIDLENNWDYLKIYDGVGTDGTLLYDGTGTDNNVSAVSTSGPLTVVFTSDGSGVESGYMLSVNCVSLTCLAVNNVEVTEPGATQMTIGWTSNGTETEWAVVFDTMPIVDADTYTATTVNTPFYTATGLQALNTYYFAIRANCSATDVSTWTYFNAATTVCDGASVAQTGNGTAPTNNAPAWSYYNYSYSETIIDSADLVGMTEISAFAFQTLSAAAGSYYDNCRVFLGPANFDEFSSATPVAVDTTNFVLVYSGSLNYSTAGWQTFMFDTVYNYSGQGNLLLVVDRDHGSYSSGSSFASTATGTAKTLYQYSDTYNVDPFNPTGSGSTFYTMNSRANYQLISCVAGCAKPMLANVTDLDYEHATINWTGSADSYEVSLMNNGTFGSEIAVNNAYTYTFTGLQPLTTYQYRVRAVCDAEEGLISDWVLGSFTTDSLPCFAPTNVVATPAFTSAAIDWAPGTNETHWAVRVFNTAFDSTYQATAHPYTVNGLATNMTYNVTVQALCGANGNVASETWSDTVSFTTDQCDAPINLTATVNQNSAVLSWTAGENNTGNWVVEYGPQGFNAGSGTIVNVTSTSLTLNDLEWSMDYDAYVRANCEAGAMSNWSNKATFTTPDHVGIADVNAADMSIYPNPASGNTSISLSGVSGNVRLMIVDMNGRTVRSEEMTCDGTCVKVMNVEGLASGAYFVRVMSDNYNTVKKLIVK